MPELPEVETVRRGLNELVKGKTVRNVIVRVPKMITTGADDFVKVLQQQTLDHVERRGKFLLLYFDKGAVLSHLRMEGKYFLQQQGQPWNKHVHVIFQFTDQTELCYQDVRKFGTCSYYTGSDILNSPSLTKLGMEPTEEDFDETVFYQKLQKAKTNIKTALLNQKIVAGLGNIYVDEVLFKARIHPLSKANQLNCDEAKALRLAIIETMQKAIAARGTTIRTYENAFGENGTYQNELLVYGKAGQPCPNCGMPIEKIKVGGRGTHFCPHCQKVKQ